MRSITATDLPQIRPGDALSYLDADGHRQTIERAGAMSPANLRRLLMRSGYRID